MKIGELAGRTGVPPRMLRYYEQQGLISPGRSANGYRDYAEEQVGRVQRVRSLIRTGVPTRLISGRAGPRGAQQPLDRGVFRCDLAQTLAHEASRWIEEKIACLRTSRGTIRDYLKQTRHAALLTG